VVDSISIHIAFRVVIVGWVVDQLESGFVVTPAWGYLRSTAGRDSIYSELVV
jgi:hypothetical protein